MNMSQTQTLLFNTHTHTHARMHTHMHTHTHTHTHVYQLPGQKGFLETRHMPAYGQHAPGLKISNSMEHFSYKSKWDCS